MEPELRTSDLLAELGWVRALARRLLGDSHAADDVAQESLLKAIEQDRLDDTDRRGWLGRVVKNVARQRRRSERRRGARERTVGFERAQAAPAASEVVARGALHKQVTEAVLDLPEPYASTVLYRYLDGLTTEATAERMDVAAPTVRKRLSRAIAMLRERLERDLERPVGAWAPLLLAGSPTPPVASAPLAAAPTAAIAETTPWITGALIMTQLPKLALGVLALGALALGWKVSRPGIEASDGTARGDDSSAALAAPLEEAETPHLQAPEVDAREGVTLEPRSVEDVATEQETTTSGAPFELLVSVVDEAARPVLEGNLILRWAPERPAEWSRQRRARQVPIDGKVTRVPFQSVPGEIMVRISIAGAAPVPGIVVSTREHQTQADGSGSFAEVRVELGAPFEGPSIHGNVLVDGESRIPGNLRIQRDSVGLLASVSHDPACFELGPIPRGGDELWVTSDETMPVAVPIPELVGDDRVRVDLHLETSRSMEILVLDEDTDAPTAGVELAVVVYSVRERSAGQVHHGTHQATGVSDDNGIVRLSGLPREGQVQVYAWGDLDRSLTTHFLEPDDPDPVHVTVRVQRRKARVHGGVSPGLARALENPPAAPPRAARTIGGPLNVPARRGVVVRATLARQIDNPFAGRTIELDERGGWSFETPVGTSWRVWAERDGERRSLIASIEADVEGDLGPIVLESVRTDTVLLSVTGAAPESDLMIRVRPESGAPRQRHPVTADEIGAAELSLVLDGPATVEVAYDEPEAESEASITRRVDPADGSELHVNLESLLLRTVSAKFNGAPIPGEAVLVFFAVGGGEQRVVQWMDDGHSRNAFALPSARYIWFARGEDSAPGFTGGIVDVDDSSTELHLDCVCVQRPRSELGTGIELRALDGVSFAALPERLQKMPWPPEWAEPEGGMLWLPSGLEFEVMR